MPVAKYFIALIPNPAAMAQVEAVKHALHSQHGLKGALRSPAHITLHRPFEWPLAKTSLLLERLAHFEFGPELNVCIQNFGWFEPRVIFAAVAPNVALDDLHTRLTKYCKKELKLFNESDDLRGFHPHITVAFRDLKKKKFYELQAQFANEQLQLDLKFTGIALLKMEERWEIHRQF